uniref:Pre-mRNA-splicing factor 38 n=1 Tax=Ciona savignyi TaxID=51511 RepID=H2ZEL3_CIOSA
MDGQYNEDAYEEEYEDQGYEAKPKLGNTLTCWGNPRTMNLNHLVLTNVQNSPYFKVRLFELKTYHEVVDEIYYKVDHLEPWERGTRKTAGQTGMCGGVRGVGAGGVVSTSFCILFKLFTLKLTRKQVNGLLNHTDSPFIRGLGVMYIRYTQAPKDLWNWYEPYLEDEEEIDVKAGGGCVMTIGMMIRTVLTKLDWFSTLFPRIPVPIQKEIDEGLSEYGMTGLRRGRDEPLEDHNQYNNPDRGSRAGSLKNSPAEQRSSRDRGSKHRSPDVRRPRSRSREHRRQRSRSRDSNRRRDERSRRSGSRDRKRSSRDKDSRRRSPVRSSRHRSRSRDRHHRRSPESHRSYRSR